MPDPFAVVKSEPIDTPNATDPYAVVKSESAEPGFLERLGGWGGVGAAGLRTVSGIAAGEGGPSGALISGAGEAGAQALEGLTGHPNQADPNSFLGKIQTKLTTPHLGESPLWAMLKGGAAGMLSPAARIGTAAGVGAVPFGTIAPVGRAGTAAIRSGALGAAGEAGREVASGQQLDPTAIGVSGVAGAGMGAAGSKFGEWMQSPKATKPGKFEVVPTAQTGEGTQTLSGGKINPKGNLVGAEVSHRIQPPFPITGTGEPSIPMGPGLPETRTPYGGGGGVTADEIAAHTKDAIESAKAEAAAAKMVAKENADRLAYEKIQELRGEQVPQKVTSSDTFSAPNAEGGTSRATQTWGGPDEEALGTATTPVTPQAPPTPPAPTPSANPLRDFLAGTPAPEKYTAPAEIAPPGVRNIGENVVPISDNLPLGERLAPQTPIPPVTPESIAAAKAARDAELAQFGEQRATELDNARAEDARSKFSVVPPTEAPPTPAAPESPLARFFKGRQGATGANYGDTKLDPTADPTAIAAARDAHLIELGRNPEGPLAPQGQPPVTPTQPPSPDWVSEQSNLIDRLKKLGTEESGSINPALLSKLGLPVAGAIGGGAIGGATSDPGDEGYGALKGALAGGTLGYYAESPKTMMKNLTDIRNAGLLLGPAQLKKPLSDMGAYIGEMGEQAFKGKAGRQIARNMATEALRVPTNVKNFIAGVKDPMLSRGDLVGDTTKLMEQYQNMPSYLKNVVRPFAGAQHATSQAMMRAGLTPEAAEKTMMLGEPEWPVLQKWLDLQNTPGVGGQVVRALRPFARIGTNIFERGAQRIPGISMITGDPETKLARTAMGGLMTGAGAITGASDAANAEAGDPTSPVIKGLRRAGAASYGLPFAIGEALGGRNATEVYNLIPGMRQTISPPGPKDSVLEWLGKLGANELNQILPSILSVGNAGQGTAR